MYRLLTKEKYSIKHKQEEMKHVQVAKKENQPQARSEQWRSEQFQKLAS